MVKVMGHVLIRDKVTHETLLDKHNQINPENLSIALASGVADRTNGHIFQMVFGNGGSTVSAVSAITYNPPNVTGQEAALYNQTYAKIVDDMSPLNLDQVNNYMLVQHTINTMYSDVQVTCTLEYGEPANQSVFDNAAVPNWQNQSTVTTNSNGQTMYSPSATSYYIFDELGLTSYNSTGKGLLLSHVIFHPIQKALNRAIEVIYTIRIVMG